MRARGVGETHKSAPVETKLEAALSHHQAGRLAEANRLFSDILSREPRHVVALHLLGVIAYQEGDAGRAIELIGKAIALRPDYAEAHGNLGNALKDQGKLDQAAAAYRKVLELMPGHADAHSNLGNALKDQGKLDEAVASYRNALAIKPDHADAHSHLGTALVQQGKLDKAVAAYRKVLALKPDHAEAHYNLGNALKDQGKLDAAVAAYREAMELKPDYAGAHSNLGNVFRIQGKLDEAVAAYRKALELKPDYAEAQNNLGIALQDQGKLDDAVAAYDKAIVLQPDYAVAHYLRSLIYRFFPGDPEIDRLKSLLKRGGLSDLQRATILSALGEACDQIGFYEEAFSSFREANRAMARERPFDARTHCDWVAAIKAIYTPKPVPAPAPAGAHVPIFVLGMSRSGKILVESRLTQADHVFRAGESLTWLETVAAIREKFGVDGGFPQYFARFSNRQAGVIGTAYLEKMLSLAPAARFSVHTLPGHYWSIGLILQAIPYARIIDCRRNPMDCCLRNFIRWYSSGNSHSNDLADTALYFKTYREIMEFWGERFGDRIFRLGYEELVRNPADTARALFDFCGLDGDPDAVATDFTTGDIGHWRNYEAHLGPLRDALERLVPETMTEVRDS